MDKYTYKDAKYYYHNQTTTMPLEMELSKAYGKVVGNLGRSVPQANYSQFILEEATKDTFTYRQTMVAGADFDVDSTVVLAKAMYNAVPLHALPVSVNLLSNAILKNYAR